MDQVWDVGLVKGELRSQLQRSIFMQVGDKPEETEGVVARSVALGNEQQKVAPRVDQPG